MKKTTAAAQSLDRLNPELDTPFFALSADLMCILSLDGALLRCNPACESTLGFAAAELVGKSAIAFVYPGDRRKILRRLRSLLYAQEPIHFEIRCSCQDGTFKWLAWRAIFEPTQQLVYATAHDITQRRQSAKQLRFSEERFRLLVEGVKDYAIYMLDPNGVVVSWNPGAERIKGYSEDEIIGKHFSCFYPPAEVEQGRPEFELQQAIVQGRFESEGERVRKDGSRFWVNAVVTALRSRSGKLRGFTKVTRDITERKESEEALKQAFDDLDQRVQERTQELSQANHQLRQEIAERKQAEAALRASEAQLKQQAQQLQDTLHELQQAQAQLVQSAKMSSLGQLVAGVAHEINNPVSFIYGNVKYADEYVQTLLQLLQLYQQQYPEPTQEIYTYLEKVDLDFLAHDLKKLLQSMKVGAERIREIVRSLRNFSRLDEAEMKAVNIHEGLDNTLLILQNRCKANASHPGITVIRDYGKLPAVECYAGQLNQVFMNILANAIDALEAPEQPQPQPCIQIRTTALPNHWVVIQITDNGPGMSETVQQRLFDPFFTTKPVGKGVGLGLAISYQIIEKHGGRLKCHSCPGTGTEFTIEIPSATVYRIPAAIANPTQALLPQSSPPRFHLNSMLPAIAPAAVVPAPLKTGNLTQVQRSEPSIVSE